MTNSFDENTWISFRTDRSGHALLYYSSPDYTVKNREEIIYLMISSLLVRETGLFLARSTRAQSPRF